MKEWLEPVVFTFFAIAGWVVFSYFLAHWSGWQALAKVYRASRPALGETIRPWGASMRGGTNYNSLLGMKVDSQGVYLFVFFLFRPGHPPLYIPWGDLSATPEKQWWFKIARITFEGCPSTYLMIPRKTAERLSQASGLQFRISESPAD